MDTDESAWSRRGTEPIVARTLGGTRPVEPYEAAKAEIRGAVAAVREDHAEIRGDSVVRTHEILGLILSGPSLALAAFAFACAQLMGSLVPGELASMIPGAADSPTNHVRIVSLFDVGMAGIGIALAAAAFVRLRAGRTAPTSARWAGWVAGAAVVIFALVAVQSLLLIILSALAPPGAPG